MTCGRSNTKVQKASYHLSRQSAATRGLELPRLSISHLHGRHVGVGEKNIPMMNLKTFEPTVHGISTAV